MEGIRVFVLFAGWILGRILLALNGICFLVNLIYGIIKKQLKNTRFYLILNLLSIILAITAMYCFMCFHFYPSA